MREIIVTKKEEGQQLMKLLPKYLTSAPPGFFYKMLRKKNITLNGRKAEGKEKTAAGDCIRIYVSDDTLRTFGGEVLLTDHMAGKQEEAAERTRKKEGSRTEHQPGEKKITADETAASFGFQVLYEDTHILLVSKPAGMLTQKAAKDDISLNEKIIAYLLATGELTERELKTFHPSVCNRLDRNTSGIVAAGKTMAGLQFLSNAFRERSLHKYYTCLAEGEISAPMQLSGWLKKDETENMVSVFTTEELEARYGSIPREYCRIQTNYRPIQYQGAVQLQKTAGNIRKGCAMGVTYLEVELITGKPHQIRAHLASLGHAILGDSKYSKKGETFLPLKHQMLHAGRLVFAEQNPEPFSCLNGKTILAPEPELFLRVKEKLGM